MSTSNDGIPDSPPVEADRLAASTQGMTGADPTSVIDTDLVAHIANSLFREDGMHEGTMPSTGPEVGMTAETPLSNVQVPRHDPAALAGTTQSAQMIQSPLEANVPSASASAIPPGAFSGLAHQGYAEAPSSAGASPGQPDMENDVLPASRQPEFSDFDDDSMPAHTQTPSFMVPLEVNLLPEPRDIHKAVGVPSLPEGIEHDTEETRPYWLQAKEAGVSIENSLQPIPVSMTDMHLPPTQVIENLPDPPERPPAQPPSKEWIVGKLKDMSGQVFVEPVKKETDDRQISGFYWLPSTSGIKHGDKQDKSMDLRLDPGYFDVETVRKDFSILSQKVNGKPLVWLDNAATTQKPQAVIDRISKFYEQENSNVHRAAHELAARSTDAYEAAREKVQKFIGAGDVDEIIFTRGTTESINLVAQTYGKVNLGKDDEIIVSEMEHHSNIVPWQHITKETGARIVVAPFHDSGEIDLVAYERLFNKRTRMVAITHVSNALGTVVPVKEMVATAHRYGVVVLIDGAQSVPHFPVNVLEIDADFYALSGHKLFGPTGVGVLYGKKHLLEQMPPWQGGGNMIEKVKFEETTYNPPPSKFEAGTAILAGAVGLGAAIDYLEGIGFANAALYEHELLQYAQEKLAAIDGVTMIGTAKNKAGILSLITDSVSHDEMGEILNAEGIAVRTGHHCAQPALAHYGLEATVRPSIAFYNTRSEIDLLVDTIDRAVNR